MTVSIAPKQYGLTFTIGDIPASATLSVPIGNTIDQARMLRLQQSTAGVTITLPTPSDSTIVYGLDLINEGTASTIVEGVTLNGGQGARFGWNGSAWYQLGGPSSGGVWAPIGRYNPLNDSFSAQLSTTHVTLPVASPANSGQVFELTADANTTNWASPNTTGVIASEGDWLYSDGTSWILWRNQNRDIGQGDTSYGATEPVERTTTHPLQAGDLWLSSVSNEMHQLSAGGLWERINDPVTILTSAAGVVTNTRSESYVAADNVGLIAFGLNATPSMGEHVRVYWDPTITGTGSFSINGKTYDKSSELSFVDVVYSGTPGIWHSYETLRQSTSDFTLKGLFYADQNRIDDLVTGSTIAGGLPAASAGNLGHAYIAAWSVAATSWATPNMPAVDIGQGDLIISSGISWEHRRMTDRVIGAGDITLLATAPTSRTHVGAASTLFPGDLWISNGDEENRLWYRDNALTWQHIGADDMSKALVATSFLTASSTLNQSWLIRFDGTDAIEFVPGAYDGQILRFIRDTDWSAGTPTLTMAGTTIVYRTDADKLQKNKIGEIVAVYEQATNQWLLHHVATIGGGVEVASAAPAPAGFSAGDMWWDDVNLELYVLHDDGSTKAWVSTSGTGGPLTSVVQSAAGAIVDCSLGNVFDFTANAALTLNFTNPPAVGLAYVATVRVIVGASGSLSYPASVKWPSGVAPVLAANAAKSHILTFMTIDGGATYFGNALTDY